MQFYGRGRDARQAFRRAEGHQGRKSKSKSRALFEGLKSYFEITFQAFFWVKWASAG